MPRFLELSASDAARYNALLSEGTRLHPLTLRIAAADIEAAPFTLGENPESVTLALLDESDAWLGTGSLERDSGRQKRRHLAWITRMLVMSPGKGVGRQILRELKTRAARMTGVEKVNLTVAADNAAAVHLYRSEGFVEFSREPDAFRSDGQQVTELTMSWTVASDYLVQST